MASNKGSSHFTGVKLADSQLITPGKPHWPKSDVRESVGYFSYKITHADVSPWMLIRRSVRLSVFSNFSVLDLQKNAFLICND